MTVHPLNPHQTLAQMRPPSDGSAVRYMRPQQAANITNGYLAALRYMTDTIGEDRCYGDEATLRVVIDGAEAWRDHLTEAGDPGHGWRDALEEALAEAECLVGSVEEGRQRP